MLWSIRRAPDDYGKRRGTVRDSDERLRDGDFRGNNLTIDRLTTRI